MNILVAAANLLEIEGVSGPYRPLKVGTEKKTLTKKYVQHTEELDILQWLWRDLQRGMRRLEVYIQGKALTNACK